MRDASSIAEELNEKLNGEVQLSGEGSLTAGKERLIELMRTLKDNFKYSMLIDITAADYSEYMELIYQVMDLDANLLTVKVKLSGGDNVMPSLIPVWKAADVQEREIFDMFGVEFEGHPNLKRILCPDDFEGHPLKKDFKLDIADRF